MAGRQRDGARRGGLAAPLAVLLADRVVADVLRYRKVAATSSTSPGTPTRAARSIRTRRSGCGWRRRSESLARHTGLSFAVLVKLPVLAADIGDRGRAPRALGRGARAAPRVAALDLRPAPGGRPRDRLPRPVRLARAAVRPARDLAFEDGAGRRRRPRALRGHRPEVVPGPPAPGPSPRASRAARARALRGPRRACRSRCCSSPSRRRRRRASRASCSPTAAWPTSAGSAPGAACAGWPAGPRPRRGAALGAARHRAKVLFFAAYGLVVVARMARRDADAAAPRRAPGVPRLLRRDERAVPAVGGPARAPACRTAWLAIWQRVAAAVGLAGFYLFLAPGVLAPEGVEPLSRSAAGTLWVVGATASVVVAAGWLVSLLRSPEPAARPPPTSSPTPGTPPTPRRAAAPPTAPRRTRRRKRPSPRGRARAAATSAARPAMSRRSSAARPSPPPWRDPASGSSAARRDGEGGGPARPPPGTGSGR